MGAVVSFDEEPHDPFRGRGEPFSKGLLLRIAVQSGAVLTGYNDGVECPYYGVHDHANQLMVEGLLTSVPGSVPNTTIWQPTDLGRIIGR